jgi:hypothetical protein
MTTATLTDSKLAHSILTARTPADVTALLAEAAKLGISSARPFGDREMNAATIEIASSPYTALGERVTNGLDAVIEPKS